MKQWKRLRVALAMTAMVVMLAGCQKPMEDYPVPTPTSVQEVTDGSAPTETITPTVTNTPVPTAEPTVVPPATSTPVPTAIPTAEPTVVPTVTNAPVPTTIPTVTPTAEPTKMPAVAGDDALTGLTAFEITSQMIVGWNLGNTLDSTGSNITYDSAPAKAAMAWGNEEPTKELFEAVKAGGFNTVRIPTTWYQHIKYDSSKDLYIISPEWMAYVKQTVDYAYGLDMFIILNCHHEEWANAPEFTDAAYNNAAKILEDIWTQVAETFADYDQHLIFEGMNEPRQTGLGGSIEWGGGDKETWQYINNLNRIFVAAVRGQGSAENRERLLMLPGYGASSNIATVKSIEVPENSGNVALSVHAYYPYFFAMATDSYANHSFPGKSGYGEDYEKSIADLFKQLKNISKEKNVPIIIGECGASDFNNPEDRARWAKHFFGKAKEAEIPCVLWDNQAPYNGSGEAHGYIYRKTYTWFENSVPMLNAMMEVYGQKNSLPKYEAYVKPAFDWNSVGIGADWVQIFRADSGQQIDDWGNIWLDNWKPYLNENYDMIAVYDSEAEPYMVLQGGWHKVFAGNVSNSPYQTRFTFEDIQNTMAAENVKLEDMTGFFVSANGKKMTVYGVYAVPVK